MGKSLYLLAIVALTSVGQLVALGEDSLPMATSKAGKFKEEQHADANDSTTGGATTTKPLQGGVQKIELGLEKLRDVELDLRSALRATSSLYDEVTIQPVRVVMQPTMVGAGTIVNIPIGTEPIGPLQPARKERVDLAINVMKPIIDMLKKNVDEFMSGEKQLDLSEAVNTKLQPQLQEWIKIVNTIAAQQSSLEQITQAPPYNNGAIAELAGSMERNIKELDKVRVVIYKVIRKEGKRSKSKV